MTINDQIKTPANDQRREELADQLDALLGAKPETGEQWAEICRIEDEMAKMERGYIDPDSQFGVGA